MKLEILDKNDELTVLFGSWLIREIQNQFILQLNPGKLKNWDKFFEESKDYKSLYNKKISTQEILLHGIKTLVCDKIPGKLIIRLNNNQFVPGLDRVRVDTVIRLITFGNTLIQGYPLLLDVLDEVAENINDYTSMYLEGIW